MKQSTLVEVNSQYWIKIMHQSIPPVPSPIKLESKECLTCHFMEPNSFKATKQAANFTASPKNWIFPLALRAWFSLAHKHKYKDIRTHRMAYLTQFSIPVLLNRNDKQDGRWRIRHIALDMFAWGLGQSDLPLVHSLVLMLVLISTMFSLVKVTMGA